MLKYAVAFVSLAGVLSAQAALTLHVSPSGSDANPGTRERPFATLEGARDAIRSLKREQGLPDGGVLVAIEAGTYRLPRTFELTAEDSGTAAAPIVYRAAQRGAVSVSGGAELVEWKPVTDAAIVALIDPAARGKLVYADLVAGELARISGFANGGCGYKGTPEYPLALYQDQTRLPISRWPNEGYAQMGECLGKSVDWGRGIKFVEGRFQFGDARLGRWVNEPDLWFDGLWYWPWADQKMACRAVDVKAKTITLANPESHQFGFKKGQEFFAFNAIGEIDRPGEWAVDRARRRLYLWPAADPAGHAVSVSLRSSLVTAAKVEHVRFEDLVFEHSVATAIALKDCVDVVVSGSVLRHTGSWGVTIDGGSDCTVIGCDLYDLGEGGVKASGGIRATLTPGNHLIENNHIHHFGQFVNTYRPGAAVYGVGNKIRHNLIHHAQHQAVFFNGNDHLIEYNIVHDVCLHTSDAGAVYACTRDWSQRGTVIRNNLIHTTARGTDGCGSHGIYMDDSTSGTTIVQNIVVDVGVGITTCGLSNRVENNICVNTRKPAVQLSSRGIDSFAKANAAKGRESSLFRKFLRDEELFRSDLWRKRYPNLLAILDMDPVEAHDSHFSIMRNNANVGGIPASVSNAQKVMRTCTIENNINLYEDPGFADMTHLDLRLRGDAPLLTRLPDFQAPEFAKMGLYADARRASPAVKFGEGASAMPVIQPRIPRPELKPRYILEELAGTAFAADGTADAKEWPETRKPQLECANKIYKQPSKLACKVRVGFDGQALRFLVTVEVNPAKGVSNEGKWGRRDGIELALSDTGEDAPVFLLHGYPDGTFEITTSAAGAQGVEALTNATSYGAKAEKGRWTAELALPLAPLGIKPEAFREIRFNMNVHRTCDDTWTCWWTPENGISDLLSSGLLILPRVLPESDEMVRRREAARPLFAAEEKGDLHWQLLKDWEQLADPDCLGPAELPAAAARVSFGDYAGWAVVRRTVPVSAEQLASPFCALFLPCVDEEGDVYLDGGLAVSHTAKATGVAPGLLWREPVLVDLKTTARKPGDVKVAVQLRGNMGTGGLRKGAFLVWGAAPFSAEQIYDFLAENPKLGWREKVPAFWQDLERVHLPPLPAVPDEESFGKRMQRTMDLLASSSPQKRNRVRILFYGQSIVQGMHCREMINTLRTRFPWAIIDFENQAIGGFTAPSLVRTAVHDLYPRDADLVVFHVYGGERDGTLEQIIAGMRQRNSSDILVYTHHYTWTADPEKLASGLKSRDDSASYWMELAEKYQLEVAPVRRDWPLFFRKYDWGINEVMGDTVHSNVHHNPTGHTLLAELVLRNFRHHVGNPTGFPQAVTTVDLTGDAVRVVGDWQRSDGGLRATAKDARLTLTFVGDRVDVLPLQCAKPGTARILIDGKSPAEMAELYYCTRPSNGPYIWMPAIKRVTLGDGVLPRPEIWTLIPENADIAKKSFQFRLEGSVTGPDGTGDRSADFVSTSGRIKLAKSDFHIIWPCTYRKKTELPDGYKVTWEVKPLFVDPWRPAAHADAAYERPVTLVRGLANGPHTLEIVANGDGEIPIKALIVRQPSMP